MRFHIRRLLIHTEGSARHSIQPLTFILQVCVTLQVPACPQFLKTQSQIVLLKSFSKFKVKWQEEKGGVGS